MLKKMMTDEEIEDMAHEYDLKHDAYKDAKAEAEFMISTNKKYTELMNEVETQDE